MAPLVILSARKQLSPFLQNAIWLWATLNFLSILFVLPIPVVTALTPISVYGMAYATISEDKFIIQGGIDYQNPTLAPNVPQFMVLDLTLPIWDTINPPWSYVPIAVPLPVNLTTSFHSMSVSPDRNTFMIWDSALPGSLTSFDMFKEAWTSLAVPVQLQISLKELKAATNPLTGKVYIPLGDRDTNMLIWDPARPNSGAGAAAVGATPSGAAPDATAPSGAGTISYELMPAAVGKGSIGYTWTWCPSRKTFILFGGKPGADPTAPYLHEFQPKTNKWTEMNTTGDVPPRLIGSCMEPAYKGTKMILFGGLGIDSVATGSIYILDLPAMVWSKGPDLDALQNRSHMACGVSGDNFLVFGGIRRTDPANIFKVDPIPLIYNIYSKLWVPRFERGSHYIAPSSTTPTPTKPTQPVETSPKPSTSSGLNGGVIAGIASSIVAFIAIAVGAFFYFKRRQPRQVKQDGDSQKDDKAEFGQSPRHSTVSHQSRTSHGSDQPGGVGPTPTAPVKYPSSSGTPKLPVLIPQRVVEPSSPKPEENPNRWGAQSNDPQLGGSHNWGAGLARSTDGQTAGQGSGTRSGGTFKVELRAR
ncbi:hypothetical protein BG015_000844 [Linnemannia schmuckeri]|uniref:Kelch repeat-containing protein n=1 Tax=Linnemannia schmuckeri TaxID=64567 RepID=A0A9P5RR04_9FUNG|nr:hypothetical protein BG015_000844 [Linnemannia schmuckeri]